MMNVITMQRHIFNANTSMDISTMMNILTSQLGTSCSFDSPGLPNNSAGYPGVMYIVWETTP